MHQLAPFSAGGGGIRWCVEYASVPHSPRVSHRVLLLLYSILQACGSLEAWFHRRQQACPLMLAMTCARKYDCLSSHEAEACILLDKVTCTRIQGIQNILALTWLTLSYAIVKRIRSIHNMSDTQVGKYKSLHTVHKKSNAQTWG